MHSGCIRYIEYTKSFKSSHLNHDCCSFDVLENTWVGTLLGLLGEVELGKVRKGLEQSLVVHCEHVL